MVNIVYTLAAMILTLMLIDYIVDKITKIVVMNKLKKSLNKLADSIVEAIDEIDEEEVEEDERD